LTKNINLEKKSSRSAFQKFSRDIIAVEEKIGHFIMLLLAKNFLLELFKV